MNVNDKLCGFTVKRVRPLVELGGEMIELTHDKTGLEAIWLKRDEENKTFGMAFETLPWNDTGVFHILEHSVLCGSDKYQVKEPFVELLKNSMNTFLNAITFPDKTVYPVCSRNNKDFINLMRVYLDAVFHPLIYSKPEIFHQEGWHYDFDENGVPSYKGVVFNEMKGAFASADTLLEEALSSGLFPDSPYKYVSGGDPAKIPDLCYEEFISSHKKFYSPSNAYLFLDGDMDIEEILGIIENDYLCDLERGERIAPPVMQAPVKRETVEVKFELGEGEDPAKKTRVAWGGVVGRFDEKEKIAALDILCDVLSGSNQAPLNKTVLSMGLAEEVSVTLESGVAQPWLKVEAKNLEAGDTEKVMEVIFSELKRLSEEGLDHDQINAVMANYEFKLRERDYGYAPQGLIFCLSALETWIYGGDPIDNLEVGDLFVKLREKMENGWFEQLIKELILENEHCCTVVLTPSADVGEERRKAEADRLAAEMASFDSEKIEKLKAEQATLEAWQHSEDTPEALKTLPSLELSDVSSEPEHIPTEETEVNGIKFLKHDVNTNGIVYYNLYFDADGLSESEISKISFMCDLWGELETTEHSEAEMINIRKLLCGNLGFGLTTYEKNNELHDCKTKLVVSFSSLRANCEKALKFVVEILTKTLLDKESVALDILRQLKMQHFQHTVMGGNSIGISRLSAQRSVAGVINEYSKGFEYYKWLKSAEESWDWSLLSADMKSIVDKIVTSKGLTVSVTGGDEECVNQSSEILLNELPDIEAVCTGKQAVKEWGLRKEAIVIPADIAFACCGEAVQYHDGTYAGGMDIATRIISLAYLWNVIRVQGGAYGTGCRVRPDGILFCYSYRDPSGAKSLEKYKGASQFLRDLANSEPDLIGFIIGTVAEAQPLLTPKAKGMVADGYYWREVTMDDRRSFLDGILKITPAMLRVIADVIGDTVDNSGVCVVAGRNQLDLCETFDLTETL